MPRRETVTDQDTRRAVMRCVWYAALLLLLYCVVVTDGYSRLLLGQWPGWPNPFRPFARGNGMATGIGILVLGMFVFLDYLALNDFESNWGNLSRPSDYPRQYAGMRLRRYIIIPFVLFYVLLAVWLLGWSGHLTTWAATTNTGEPRDPVRAVTNYSIAVCGILFALARRPQNFKPAEVVGKVRDFAVNALEQADKGGRHRE